MEDYFFNIYNKKFYFLIDLLGIKIFYFMNCCVVFDEFKVNINEKAVNRFIRVWF